MGLHMSSETPEGQSVGLVKNLSCCCEITHFINPESIYQVIANDVILFNEINIYEYDKSSSTKVFINGKWYGFVANSMECLHKLKEARRKGYIHIHVSFSIDFRTNEIHIYSDPGRCVRPLHCYER